MISVNIKDKSGALICSYDVLPTETVQELKLRIAADKSVPVDKLQLSLSLKQDCTDEQSLADLKCPNDLLLLPTEVWLQYHDKDTDRPYYFDTQTQTTHWELPIWTTPILGPEGEDYELLDSFKPTDKHAKYAHLLRPNSWLEGKMYLQRPARKQIDKPFIKDFAYQQGDDEYNFWFDKYLNDKPVRDRAPASTRCDLEQDIGYTKADLMEPETAYWCLHFVRGCCSEGGNCRFFHRIPSMEECKRIAHMKDLFGRTRHSAHRDDMGGIGCFQRECRTLCVCDVKIPPGADPVEQVNEMLWRHFSLWGRVEDITFIPSKCMAFIKYYHRCYAELSKEAMRNQSLDYDEVLTIKWANDDPNPSKESQFSEAWHKAQLLQEKEKKTAKRAEKKAESEQKKPETALKTLPEPINITEYEEEMKRVAKDEASVVQSAVRMQQVLQRIHKEQLNTLNQIVFPPHLQQSDQVPAPQTTPPPALNDEPLSMQITKKRKLR